MAGEIGGRHLAAQQHLVADHERGDDAGIFLGETDRGRNLRGVLQPVAAEPDALHHLEPGLGGQRRHLVEAVLDRIGPHAVGDLGELRQILRDLLGRNMRGRVKRRLRAAERRVGHAEQLRLGVDRRARQRDRRRQPPPHGSNCTKRNEQKRQWRTQGNRFHPPRTGPSISRLGRHLPRAVSTESAACGDFTTTR